MQHKKQTKIRQIINRTIHQSKFINQNFINQNRHNTGLDINNSEQSFNSNHQISKMVITLVNF